MTWGAFYMYYHCPECGVKFKYSLDMLAQFGEEFGECPECRAMGVLDKEGAIQEDDSEYMEID